MSVLKNKRKESIIQYVYTAYKIYTYTIEFISRLSARYSRLMAADIAHTAFEILRNCESANTIVIIDEETYHKRRSHLTDAKTALSSLDVFLSLCYDILSANPSGAMTNKSNKPITASEANHKLDNMVQTLGELIDEEMELINRTIKSDKATFKRLS